MKLARAFSRDARGTVMVETMIALMPVLMLFLGTVQFTLLSATELVVRHAAVTGVRAAVVVLDDDPAHYDGAERLVLRGSPGGARASDAVASLASQALGASLPNFATPNELSAQAPTAGPRLQAVQNAVYAKLAAIVPANALALLSSRRSVEIAIGRSPLLRLAQAPIYLPITTAITFPRAPGGRDVYEERIEPGADTLTVRITHFAACTVPLVARLMCRRDLRIGRGDDAGRWPEELDRAPLAALQERLTSAGVDGVVLQAEASMPLQTAPYRYESERDIHGEHARGAW